MKRGLVMLVAVAGYYQIIALWALVIILPLHLLCFHNIRQARHFLLRNYPLVGYLRGLFESIRPGIG